MYHSDFQHFGLVRLIKYQLLGTKEYVKTSFILHEGNSLSNDKCIPV